MLCPVRRSRCASNLARTSLLVISLLIPGVAAAQTGSISGTVTDAATGAPIAGVAVGVFTPELFGERGNAVTNAAGVYTVSGLAPGQYIIGAFPSDDDLPYLDEAFDNIPCPVECDEPEGLDATLVTVTSGATTTINFALDKSGTITGTVTNAATGAPLQNVTVEADVQRGTDIVLVASAVTDASGSYTLSRLPEGPVYLNATNNQGFVNEIYDGIVCVGACPSTIAVASGTAVAVTHGLTTSGRDFALAPGGAISGTITNSATGAPIQNVTVNITTKSGTGSIFVNSAITNASGVYTVGGLPTGTYSAFTATGNVGVTSEIFDNIRCPLNCNGTVAAQSGVEIPVTEGATTSGRNFSLDPGGEITGVVTEQPSARPLPNVTVTVITRVGTTFYQRNAVTNATGVYAVRGLPSGTYWAYVSNAPGLVTEIYDNVPCLGPCNQNTVVTAGTPIAVTQGATTAGRDFGLLRGGGISGTIRDAATTNPITDIGVELYAQSGTSTVFVSSTGVDNAGAYSFSGLPAGTYYVTTTGNDRYRHEAFNDIPCVDTSCDSVPASATPVPVALGTVTSGRDFDLVQAGHVRGRVTSSATGLPLQGVTVNLYQRGGSGVLVARDTTDVRGHFFFHSLPNGSYVAFTSNTLGYVNKIHSNIACATTCSPATAVASGAVIDVTGTDITRGIDFVLDVRNGSPAAPINFRATASGFAAQFNWVAPTPSTTGVPVSYIIDAGVTRGGTIISIPAGTGTSFTSGGIPPGTFYVRVRAVNAFGSSPPSNEVTLVMTSAGVAPPDAPTNAAAFMNGGLLTLTWAAAITGGPATGFVVEAGSASGLANIATLPVSGRDFSFTPVPNGVYFLRVRAVNAGGMSARSAEVMIVVGNVPSPPGAPNFTALTATGSTITLTWTAPTTFGAATGYIIEAGSATGLTNIATLNTGNTNTTASFSGVPPGTYYVRIRAVNAQGASVVSNERVITNLVSCGTEARKLPGFRAPVLSVFSVLPWSLGRQM